MREFEIQTIETTHGLYVSAQDVIRLLEKIWKRFPCRVSTLTYFTFLKGGLNAD